MQELDLKGFTCPMPVLKTKKALAVAAPKEKIAVLTDDPHALEDIALFCKQTGHSLISQETKGGVTRHLLERKAD